MGGPPCEGSRDAEQAEELLYRLAAGTTAHSVYGDAGDAHHSRSAGIRRTGGQAVLPGDGQQAEHGGGAEGVPGALLSACAAPAGAFAPGASYSQGSQAA